MSISLLYSAFEALPDTDQEKCADALDDGNYLLASFYCPAGTWLSEVFGGGEDYDEEEEP